MKRCFLLTVCVLIAWTLHVPAAEEKPAKTDAKQIVGKWTVVGFELDGMVLPDAAVKKANIAMTISDKKIVLKTAQKEQSVSYKLAPDKKPKEIDTVDLDGAQKGKVTLGIYHLDGDTLKMCMKANGKGRPTEFASKKGSGIIVLIMKREKQ
jgi:uncharacterized protein (TIGR03067 family)